MATFSRVVNSGNRWWNWKTNPMSLLRSAALRLWSRPPKFCPEKKISPLVGASRVPSRCRRVVLPEPDAPRMAMDSPGMTVRSIPSSTVRALPWPSKFLANLVQEI